MAYIDTDRLRAWLKEKGYAKEATRSDEYASIESWRLPDGERPLIFSSDSRLWQDEALHVVVFALVETFEIDEDTVRVGPESLSSKTIAQGKTLIRQWRVRGP